jgi:NTE family protein
VKVGLVLGGGGVTGAAWLMGALEALEAETGWQACRADRIVGTSAGAVVGAMVCGGVAVTSMRSAAASAPLQAYAEAEDEAADSLPARLGRLDLRLAALPVLGIGSWRLALATLANPLRHAPPVVLTGWMPRGFMSTRPIEDLVRTYAGDVWPAGGRFRAVAADYRTGRRVPFGRPDAPPAALPAAVAASCAIPALYRPVRIDGRDYVDGGICSASNLDLLCRTDVDLALCLNPMSSRGLPTGSTAQERLVRAMRTQVGRRLGHEARKLREAGKEVVLLQPGAAEAEVMGANALSGRRRAAIAEHARRSVAASLRRLRADGVRLPGRDDRPRRSAVARAA